MKRHERIAAVILVIGGLGVVYYGYAVLKLGSIFQPDAGFFPFLSGIALVVLGICWFVVAPGIEDREKAFSEKGRWVKPALAMGIIPMAQIGQPIDYLGSKEWAAFMQKASKDYGDLIKELGIKL